MLRIKNHLGNTDRLSRRAVQASSRLSFGMGNLKFIHSVPVPQVSRLRKRTMWIHDNIGVDALIVERHVCLIDDKTANSLLTVSGRELISQFWSPCLTRENLNESLIIVRIAQHNFIYVAWDGASVCHSC